MTTLVAYCKALLGLSLVAVGGANAVLPELHAIAVDRQRWLSATDFAQLFAIAQAAPGPNVLVVALIGWKLAGVGGALASIVAMCAPPALLAYAVSRVWTRFAHTRTRLVLAAVLAPLAVGLVTGSGVAVATTIGPTTVGIAVVCIATLVAWRTKLSPIVLLLAGAAAGLSGLL